MRIFDLFTRRGRRGGETSRVDTGNVHEPPGDVGNVTADQAVHQAAITHEDQDQAERCARWAADDATHTAAEMSEGRQWA